MKFQIIAVDSGWNDLALIAVFSKGLNQAVQTELACHDYGMDLNSLIKLAISLDQHSRSKRGRYSMDRNLFTGKRFPSPVPQELQPEPMQIRKCHISNQERRRRIEAQLCILC